ncbi:MAG: hypothetical protein WKF94_17200 [Solirubrobacteraceae bacterium]
MPDETTDPRAAVLRAAGHTEAADLLDKLDAETPPPPAPEPQGIPAWERQARDERAAGQAMLDHMKRQLPNRFAATESEEAA